MNAKIMIVEDNEQDQKIMKRLLGQAGFSDLVFVDSGESALERAAGEQPRLIIVDTNLPGMSGFEACERIKGQEGLNARVIVVTGFIDAVDAGRARKSGADDYCVKTADCVPLIEAVRRNVQGAEA